MRDTAFGARNRAGREAVCRLTNEALLTLPPGKVGAPRSALTLGGLGDLDQQIDLLNLFERGPSLPAGTDNQPQTTGWEALCSPVRPPYRSTRPNTTGALAGSQSPTGDLGAAVDELGHPTTGNLEDHC